MTNDPYRPQFHFTPQQQWMNDPNGLVYFRGEYHLFYQYHPYGTTWGPMHWGHAISGDLVNWTHAPIALAPDEHGQIFSGSAVVDELDTSGLFGGDAGLVAIFTHHSQDAESGAVRQCQSLAYSADAGRTWSKYSDNPVLADSRFPDFRDPKVIWHKQTERWVMILAAGQTVRLYTSPNLRDWTFASEFGEGEGAHIGVWECPDLFELAVDGDPAHTKWVMLVSIGSEPAYPEGSRTQYFIGRFDGQVFTNEGASEQIQWLDAGRDNYAGVSWSGIPEEKGRRIYIGWMSNWKYAQVTPTVGWRSAMTLPRTLELKRHKDEVRLLQRPVQELNALITDTFRWESVQVHAGDDSVSMPALTCFKLEAVFELGTAEEFGIKVRASEAGQTLIGYRPASKELFIDRSRSGDIAFHADFPGRHAVQVEAEGGRLKMQIWVDRSSVEVFAGEGEAVLTDLVFPQENQQGLDVYAVEGSVQLLSLQLSPING